MRTICTLKKKIQISKIEDPEAALEAALNSIEGKSSLRTGKKKSKNYQAFEEIFLDFEQQISSESTDHFPEEIIAPRISKKETISKINKWLTHSENSISSYVGCTTVK